MAQERKVMKRDDVRGNIKKWLMEQYLEQISKNWEDGHKNRRAGRKLDLTPVKEEDNGSLG